MEFLLLPGFPRKVSKEGLFFLDAQETSSNAASKPVLLQLRPQCSCHPVPSWHSDPSLALSRSPRVEFLSPDSSPGPGSEHACWREGVESPVWGKEGIAQYYIILKKAILSRVSSQTPRAQTSQSLQWLTLAPLCSF